jgi:hypothetical protein
MANQGRLARVLFGCCRDHPLVHRDAVPPDVSALAWAGTVGPTSCIKI